MSGCVLTLPDCPDRCSSVEPSGATDCVNLTYTTPDKFDPDTLEVNLDGRQLTLGLDYTIASDNQGFTLILDPDDANRLIRPPGPNEDLRVNYTKSPNTTCVTSL